mmetsp:Transcript_23237/g.43678  ORF Transcript_23237/g.43678 Transcript_23237/m.43678 type:complete len:160 (+) Transcript_23237:45-524(+)
MWRAAVPVRLLLTAFLFRAGAAQNISYAQFFGVGCASGERVFECFISDQSLCCQHDSQTQSWYCDSGLVSRKDYAGGEDCSGQPEQEIVGFLSDTTSIAGISVGDCIDYGTTMSFRFLEVPSAALPCSAALTNGAGRAVLGWCWSVSLVLVLVVKVFGV